MKTPNILLPASRQYQHNDSSGLVPGFEYEQTCKIVTSLLAKLRELEAEAAESFLRAPSIGSDGPGSCTIVVQEYNIRRVKAALTAAKEVAK